MRDKQGSTKRKNWMVGWTEMSSEVMWGMIGPESVNIQAAVQENDELAESKATARQSLEKLTFLDSQEKAVFAQQIRQTPNALGVATLAQAAVRRNHQLKQQHLLDDWDF